MLGCVLWCDQYSEALYLVKRSKGGGISATHRVRNTVWQSGLVYSADRGHFFTFHLGACLLVAVLQSDALGGEVTSPLHLYCVALSGCGQELTFRAVFMAPHCTMSHFSLKC